MVCSFVSRRIPAALAVVLFSSPLLAATAPQCPEHDFVPLLPGSIHSGSATATDGTRVIVSEEMAAANQAVASVYRLEGDTWVDEEALVVTGSPGDSVGAIQAVEIADDIALVTYEHIDQVDFEYRIAVFERSATGWSHLQTILPPPITPAVPFQGGYLHVHGDQLLTDRLIYQRGPNGYSLLEVLSEPTTGGILSANHWGAMNDDWIVIGNPLTLDPMTPGYSGRITIYERLFHGGVLVQEFTEPVPNMFAQFGCSVALEGDWLFAGAQEYGEPGRVHAYRYDGSAWQYDQEVINPFAMPFFADRFGGDIAIDGGRLVVGSTREYELLYELIDGAWTYVGSPEVNSMGSVDLAGDVLVHSRMAPSVNDRAHAQGFFGGEWGLACAGTPNSTGAVATLDLRGSARRSYPGLVVDVADAPANTVGIFVYGGAVGSLPVGNGELCIDPASGLRRYPEIVQVDAAGAATRILDASVLDTASSGSSVVLQLWFRDVGGAGTDWSSAARVLLCD
ncbi:MAG: hypothetical protein AAF957_10325 [Planctomycetota bacterium]